MKEKNTGKTKRSKSKGIIGLILVISIVILAGCIYFFMGNLRINQKIDAGNQYLAEKNYDKAIEGIQTKTEVIKDSWNTVEEYDKTGHLVKSSLYNGEDNTLWKYTEYQYDSFGNVVSEKNYLSEQELSSDIKYEYAYDIAGNILQKTYEDVTNNNKSVTIYEYDSVTGKLRSEKSGDSITEYQYWQNGNLKEITKNNANVKEVYEYSEQGIIQKDSTYVNDTILLSESFYNGNGDLELYCSYDGGQIIDRKEYFYNAQGMLTGADVLTDGKNSTKWTYEYAYDTKGRLASETVYWSENGQTPYIKLQTTYAYWDE